MPLILVFKRSKNFVQASDNDGTKKFLAPANPSAPIPVPFWVAGTETYKRGIADLSIVNLTPPSQMPGYVAPAVVAEEGVQEPTAEELAAADAADEESAEQTELPKQEFGGQPMTPVAPAIKLGVQGKKSK